MTPREIIQEMIAFLNERGLYNSFTEFMADQGYSDEEVEEAISQYL